MLGASDESRENGTTNNTKLSNTKQLNKQSNTAAAAGNSQQQQSTRKTAASFDPMDKDDETPNTKNNKNNSSNTQQSAGTADEEEKKTDGETKKKKANGTSTTTNTSTAGGSMGESSTAATAAAAAPPPPIMKGTLSCDLDQRRHLIRGMWNYENSNVFPPQPFELVRNLGPDEEKNMLPRDGEFHGSFRLAYFHTTSKGKQKERVKVIPETGVKIKFTKVPGEEGEYKVDGKGTNQFGIFHINGTASKSQMEGDNTLNVVLRKRYESADQPASAAATTTTTTAAPVAVAAAPTTNSKKGPSNAAAAAAAATPTEDVGPLPDPSESFASGVVCLRGKVYKEESSDIGLEEVVQRIDGLWSSGLNFILEDPQNLRGLCNRFEYEHKTSQLSQTFPVSGRYSGWFDLSNDDGSRTRINERDVTLKFRKNNAGYHNVEGKGSNVFGRYSITGTLKEDEITIFRHFQPRKLKNKAASAPSTAAQAPAAAAAAAADGGSAAPAAAPAPAAPRRPSTVGSILPEPKLKLDDVKVPSGVVDPITSPANGTYSAVSRGVLRVNADGSHSCQGKWAVTREHFTNNQTSNFNFRLESHFAQEAAAEASRPFPLDSAMYKGSFQLKKQGSRYQTIVDHQVVMKFCENNQGSFNVHGKGMNAIGEFNLIGTMVMSGKTGGQVELYRMYPPEKLVTTPAAAAAAAKSASNAAAAAAAAAAADDGSVKTEALSVTAPSSSSSGLAAAASSAVVPAPAAPVPKLPGPPPPNTRRESTRLVKLPSRLEDDDPNAQLSRIMDKCAQILRIIRERDAELGAFFSEPVDPVALGIPTYYQVIKEPMDLRTITRMLEQQQITTPEEFARMVRLVFENAMTFNVDPAHSVHQAGRNLMILFNQKFRDVDRMMQNIRRDDGGKGKKKDDKKRKRGVEEPPKSLKRRRLDEAQAMAAANVSAVAAIMAAAPTPNTPHVTRSEFSMLLNLIQQLQKQVVETHTALAELCPGDENDVKAGVGQPAAGPVAPITPSMPQPTTAPIPLTEAIPRQPKKVTNKRKTPEPEMVDESLLPLSLAEQELLTETINELPHEHLPGVIQIIREAAPVGADEDEIDMEIDQLDARTQRKLLNHVSKFVKKAKGKAKKKPAAPPAAKPPSAKKAKPAAAAKGAAAASRPKAAATASAAPDSFFAFNNKNDDSDTDSADSEDGEIKHDEKEPEPEKKTSAAPAPAAAAASQSKDDFQLGTTEGIHHDDDDNDDDDDDDFGSGIAANWNMETITTAKKDTADEAKKETGDEDEDDAWDKARVELAAAKVREVERKAREEKMKREAEQAEKQRMVEAAAKLRAQRAEGEAKDAKLREQQEKEAEEAIRAAREALRAQVEAEEQTVDLDKQRLLMEQYEQSFLDKDYGSASPSSDFGF